MRTIYCANSACDGPIGMADYDAPYCRICGDMFCETACRDDHIEQQHPGWLADKEREEEMRFGFVGRAAE